MKEPITTTELRASVYRVLDQVIETKQPVEIIRSGRRLRIVLVEESPRVPTEALLPNLLLVPANEFDHIDWSDEWKP